MYSEVPGHAWPDRCLMITTGLCLPAGSPTPRPLHVQSHLILSGPYDHQPHLVGGCTLVGDSLRLRSLNQQVKEVRFEPGCQAPSHVSPLCRQPHSRQPRPGDTQSVAASCPALLAPASLRKSGPSAFHKEHCSLYPPVCLMRGKRKTNPQTQAK